MKLNRRKMLASSGILLLSSSMLLMSCGSSNIVSYDEAKLVVDRMYDKTITKNVEVSDTFEAYYSNTNTSYVEEESYKRTKTEQSFTVSLKDLYIHTLIKTSTIDQNHEDGVLQTYVERWLYIRDNQFYNAVAIKTTEGVIRNYKLASYDSSAMRQIEYSFYETKAEGRYLLNEATRTYRDEFYDTSEFLYDKTFALSFYSSDSESLQATVRGYTNDNSGGEIYHYSQTNIQKSLLKRYVGNIRMVSSYEDENDEEYEKYAGITVSLTYNFNYDSVAISYPDLSNFDKIT